MKFLILFLSTLNICLANEVDPFWLQVREGSSIYLTQRYVEQGETPKNIKLAIYMNRLAVLTTGKSLDIKSLFTQAPTESKQRLLDDGLQLQTILSEKFHQLDTSKESTTLKFTIALVCDNIGQLEEDLLSTFPPENIENRVSKIHNSYSQKYGLHLESPKEEMFSKLKETQFKSLSFNTTQLFSLINYINSKSRELGIEIEVKSILFCDDLKTSLNAEDQVIYTGTLNIKKPSSFKLENGTLMDLIQIIDLNYKVRLKYAKNKITIESMESGWKNDLLSYRKADALTGLLYSPVYEKLHKDSKTFQVYGEIQNISFNESTTSLHLNSSMSFTVPSNLNEEAIDAIAMTLDKTQGRRNSIYSKKLKVIIQADFSANKSSPIQLNIAYLEGLSTFLKVR